MERGSGRRLHRLTLGRLLALGVEPLGGPLLYRSGALTLSQAAARSGYSEDDLLLALQRHGVPVHEDDAPAASLSADRPASAD